MGVHDYSCFVHGEEGDQSLIGYYNCHCYSDSDSGNDNVSDNDSCKEDCGEQYCGECYIIIMDIPNTLDIKNTDIILNKIVNSEYKDFEIRYENYSWDGVTFENTEGYYQWYNTNSKGEFNYSIWKTLDNRWALNVCQGCYNLITKNDTKICKLYLDDIKRKHHIEESELREHFDFLIKMLQK